MSRSGLPRVLLRRWYVVAVGLLVTIGLAALAMQAVPAKYQAKASVLILPPKSTEANGGNPYLSLGGLQGVADVLARAMSDSATVAAVRTKHLTGSYSVVRDPLTSGPVLNVTAEDASPAGAVATMKYIVDRLRPTLLSLQASVHVPANAELVTEPITVPSHATPSRKSQVRAVLLAVAVGLLVTVFGAVLADRLLERRRRRAAKTAQHGAEDSRSGRDPEFASQVDGLAGATMVMPRRRDRGRSVGLHNEFRQDALSNGHDAGDRAPAQAGHSTQPGNG